MHRISKASLVAFVVAVLMSFAAPASAEWTRTLRIDRGTVIFPGGERANVSVAYHHYYQAGSYAKLKVRRVIGSYNMPGSHMSCSPLFRKYDGMKINMNFWRPYTGENFNPPAFVIPCDESTINARVQRYGNDAPMLEFGPGNGSDRQPKWAANFTLQRNGDGDIDRQYRQDFNPLS